MNLEAEADRIAALRNDPRTPAVVRLAFVHPQALTLRKFLALEDADSPVLSGRWHACGTLTPALSQGERGSEGDSAHVAQAFCKAWEIIFPGRELPPAASLGEAIAEMAAEVTRGFSTVMPMRFPRSPGAPPPRDPPDGLGWAARLIARMTAAGIPDPLDKPLDQLFIFSAALSANEGADCAGEDYRERLAEGGERKEEEGSRGGAEAQREEAEEEELARQSAAAEGAEIQRDAQPEEGGAEDNE